MLSPCLFVSLIFASSCVLVEAANSALVEDYDVLQYIDPLIGSANGGTKHHLILTTKIYLWPL